MASITADKPNVLQEVKSWLSRLLANVVLAGELTEQGLERYTQTLTDCAVKLLAVWDISGFHTAKDAKTGELTLVANGGRWTAAGEWMKRATGILDTLSVLPFAPAETLKKRKARQDGIQYVSPVSWQGFADLLLTLAIDPRPAGKRVDEYLKMLADEAAVKTIAEEQDKAQAIADERAIAMYEAAQKRLALQKTAAEEAKTRVESRKAGNEQV